MYDRVLLSIDGSALSMAAVPHAVRLAGPDGAIRAITVVRSRDMLRTDLASSAHEFVIPGATSLEDLVKQVAGTERAAASATLAEAKAQLTALGATKIDMEICEGLAGNAIIDEMHAFRADAIVLGTRGHGGLGREVVGSVAEYVLRHAGSTAVVLIGTRGGAANN